MLTSADISYLQGLDLQAMPDICSIYLAHTTINELYEVITFYSSLPDYVAVPCRSDVLKGQDLIAAQQINELTVARLTLPVWVTLYQDAKIDHLGRTWKVTHIHPLASWSTALWVDIRKDGW